MEHSTRCRSGDPELSTLLAAGKAWGGPAGTCTLLGPEGPDVVVDRNLPLDPFLLPAVCWWLWGGYRPYFENYTVDASILKMWCVSIASKR